DGADFAWVMTCTAAEAPQLAPSLDAWMRAHLPAAIAATAAAGWPSGSFVGFVDEEDPGKGLVPGWAGAPRFSTGYFPLRNRPSVLVEMHSYKPYRDRVLANRDFLLALLAEVAKDPQGLVRAAESAEARTVALGRPDAPPSDVALRYEVGPATGRLRMPLYAWRTEPSVVTGQPLLRYERGKVRETELAIAQGVVVELARPRPRGYLVLPGWPQIEARLRWHGLRVERLQEPADVEVETLRVSEPKLAAATYQGLTAVTGVEVAVLRERRTVPAGALWVPADQPDFELAAHLLEPEAPDSLLAWGLLSSVFERKEYIEPRVLEPLAVEMLRDPKVKAEWEAALRDEAFAADAEARHLWWYRRTPYWDETVGLLPIYRVVAPPRLVTRPWH
ncbi:MAG TPA: hypothetical protein VF121_07685, partial [Thermoanaerobaculia bacterium]|nr:hypothetical protein [Thermoanaerobaculia bacterium]